MLLNLVLAVVLWWPPSPPALTGIASWYAYFPQQAAAGPSLRTSIGKNWRGKVVTVCGLKCITVKLTDWCQCYGTRVIDLDARSFRAIGLPLSRGIARVTVTW